MTRLAINDPGDAATCPTPPVDGGNACAGTSCPEPLEPHGAKCECECPDVRHSSYTNAAGKLVCADTEECKNTQVGGTTPKRIDPKNGECVECDAAVGVQDARATSGFCCEDLPREKIHAPTKTDPCHSCDRCADSAILTNNETCTCACPEATHELVGGGLLDGKCTEKCDTQYPGEGRIRNDAGLCVCPPDKPEQNGKCGECDPDKYELISIAGPGADNIKNALKNVKTTLFAIKIRKCANVRMN